MPWIDEAKSYRSVFRSLSGALLAPVDCVASEGFGEHPRAFLHYVSGLVTIRRELSAQPACSYLLIQRDRALDNTDLSAGGSLVWIARRPAEQREEFALIKTDVVGAIDRRGRYAATQSPGGGAAVAGGPARL